MSDFDHLLLTRFNVRLRNIADRSSSDQWLSSRIDIFAKYCVPSIAAQTEKSFRWILLIDDNSPEWLEKRLTSAAKPAGVPTSVVRICGYLEEESLAAAVAPYVESEYLITTRIDNDDMIAKDFIEQVQDHFVPHSLVIDFPDGAQYENGAFYKYRYHMNAFISYIEEADDAVTVLRDQHPLMGRYAPVLTTRTKHPMWIQHVHGGNVANLVSGWRVNPQTEREWFPSVDLPDSSVFTLAVAHVRVPALWVARLIPRGLRRVHRMLRR